MPPEAADTAGGGTYTPRSGSISRSTENVNRSVVNINTKGVRGRIIPFFQIEIPSEGVPAQVRWSTSKGIF